MEKSEYQQMYELENNYWWYRTLHSLVEKIVIKQNYPQKDISILDAGCGTGKMLELLSKYAIISLICRIIINKQKH
jgi:ubiquinone/menaquinone biosynthesis C-methylase UbiE